MNDLRAIVDRLASTKPTPAGGAAAAVAVAHGAALLCKCVRVGTKSSRSEEHRSLIERLASVAERAVSSFDDDISAFDAVLAARSGGGEASRTEWETATRVPLSLASIAIAALVDLPAVEQCARPSMLADVGAARLLLETGIQISISNARVNLVSVEAPARAELDAALRRTVARAAAVHDSEAREIAEATKRSCLRAATEAMTEGGYAGLCPEGRFELVIDAVRAVSVDTIVTERLGVGGVPSSSG